MLTVVSYMSAATFKLMPCYSVPLCNNYELELCTTKLAARNRNLINLLLIEEAITKYVSSFMPFFFIYISTSSLAHQKPVDTKSVHPDYYNCEIFSSVYIPPSFHPWPRSKGSNSQQ